MKEFTVIFLILIPGLSFGQIDSVKIIDELVHQINNSNLTQKAFDSNKVYNLNTDNGGEITVTFDNEGNIKKIKSEKGLSWGYASTTFYFANETPIKIIEIEKNYKWDEEESKFDYSQLHEVFRWEYYIFSYNYDLGKITKNGAPKFTEPICGLYEYEPTIELIKSYVNKKTP